MSGLISVAQLAAFAPHCNATVLAPAIAWAAAEREISTPLRLAHFLGQLHEETGGFTVFVENLNYRPETCMRVWPARFPTLASTAGFAHNPEALANKVYAGRMGNTQPGDGWRFIGRGGLQITGRDNYARFGHELGLDLVGHPDLAADSTVWPRVAAAFWADARLNELADKDDIESITRRVNGGLTNLAERKTQVARAKAILGVA